MLSARTWSTSRDHGIARQLLADHPDDLVPLLFRREPAQVAGQLQHPGTHRNLVGVAGEIEVPGTRGIVARDAIERIRDLRRLPVSCSDAEYLSMRSRNMRTSAVSAAANRG